MSLEQNPIEVRTLWLERHLAWALRAIQELLGRLAAIEQQLAQLWTGLGQTQSAPATGGLSLAVLTGSLATGAPGSPSSAGATLYAEGAGSWVAGGAITVKNTYPLATPLASGKQVWVTQVNGTYYVITSEC